MTRCYDDNEQEKVDLLQEVDDLSEHIDSIRAKIKSLSSEDRTEFVMSGGLYSGASCSDCGTSYYSCASGQVIDKLPACCDVCGMGKFDPHKERREGLSLPGEPQKISPEEIKVGDEVELRYRFSVSTVGANHLYNHESRMFRKIEDERNSWYLVRRPDDTEQDMTAAVAKALVNSCPVDRDISRAADGIKTLDALGYEIVRKS